MHRCPDSQFMDPTAVLKREEVVVVGGGGGDGELLQLYSSKMY